MGVVYHQTSQSQPNLISSSSGCEVAGQLDRGQGRGLLEARGKWGIHTLEFVFSYVYSGRWVDDVGSEIVDHCGGW